MNALTFAALGDYGCSEYDLRADVDAISLGSQVADPLEQSYVPSFDTLRRSHVGGVRESRVEAAESVHANWVLVHRNLGRSSPVSTGVDRADSNGYERLEGSKMTLVPTACKRATGYR